MSIFANLLGAATGAANTAAGNAQSAAVGGLSSLLSSGLNSLTGGLAGIFGGMLGAASGSAAVHFINDANPDMTGPPYWHNQQLGLKWRDMDAFFKTYNNGNGLESFGWMLNRTPSSASGKFKSAENTFFQLIDKHAKDVADGVVNWAVWTEDPAFVNRVNEFKAANGGGSIVMPLNPSDGVAAVGSAAGGFDFASVATYVGVGLTILSLLKRR